MTFGQPVPMSWSQPFSRWKVTDPLGYHDGRDRDGTELGSAGEPVARLAAAVVIELALYGELFTADAYAPGFRPWDGRSSARVAGIRAPEGNKTPVVRQEVLQPMLAAARYLAGTIGPRVAAPGEQARRRRGEEHARPPAGARRSSPGPEPRWARKSRGAGTPGRCHERTAASPSPGRFRCMNVSRRWPCRRSSSCGTAPACATSACHLRARASPAYRPMFWPAALSTPDGR